MKKIFLVLGLLLFPQLALAQSQRNPCFYTTVPSSSGGCIPVSGSNPLPVTTANSSVGATVFFLQPVASDNHANIKSSGGQVYKISVTNNSATVNYIRLYNSGAGFNGCNSATNLMYENAIPQPGLVDSWDTGMSFSTGISICVTSGYATTDTTAATASAMNVNIGYK